MPKLFSLEGRLVATALLGLMVGTAIPWLLLALGFDPRFSWALGLLLGILVLISLIRLVLRPLTSTLKALRGGLLNFRDGDFSISLVPPKDRELGEITSLYNDISEHLRRERAHIYQRELLLDTVIQSSPQALLLVDQSDHIIYSNSSARTLLNRGRPIQGLLLQKLLPNSPKEIARAIEHWENGLFNYTDDNGIHSLHIGNSTFVLNAHKHRLIVLREMTRELTRAEVAVWKKVIRLISHELNNSLAPISSLSHSGKLLTTQPDKAAALEKVFDIIAERCEHLTEFTQGYASFAKLPAPSCETVDWLQLIGRIAPLQQFTLSGTLPERPGYFDPIQIEQALLNLLKNAREAGSDNKDIELHIATDGLGQRLVIADRGCGMSEKILHQALLPFFSTKAHGVGLGLALCREIVDAHGGYIQLLNRSGGGVQITLWLPWAKQES
ncbi:PAS domain-containing sensor histidine kinase [Microbulbifer sp. 2205BS26-8]|uniref:sensor histidine kinase n=1 Tax=Microbulbifer sp. 2205BS26-8 TaxID=3064386 RepID=UPI00273E753C|nr:ATP-binding protein [Microbulbifer sp. 2205BS26-8]MDP5209238.1 ATP-binding protein [Microbulbifer sp. 2205BS26-8]